MTLPIELDFPEKPLENRLDISEELAVQLGLMTKNGVGTLECDSGQETYSTKKENGNLIVDKGYLKNDDNELSCRQPRNKVLSDGTPLLEKYYDFWKDAIQTAWNRTDFEIEVLIVGYDTIADSLMTAFKKDGVVWENYLTLDENQRARYRPGFAHIKHMHTGLLGSIIAHETGHYLGLDDEYREDDKGSKNEWRNCSTHNCAKGVLGIGRNYCASENMENERCSADKQCASPAICKGKPVGKCITEDSVALGGKCVKDAQCETGSCNKDGRCQCKDDNDCSGNKKCKKPIGKPNYCS